MTLEEALAFYKGGTQTEITGRHYRVCFGLREDTEDFNSCFPGEAINSAQSFVFKKASFSADTILHSTDRRRRESRRYECFTDIICKCLLSLAAIQLSKPKRNPSSPALPLNTKIQHRALCGANHHCSSNNKSLAHPLLPEQPLQEAAAKNQKKPHFTLMEVVTLGYSCIPGLLNEIEGFRMADSLTTTAF